MSLATKALLCAGVITAGYTMYLLGRALLGGSAETTASSVSGQAAPKSAVAHAEAQATGASLITNAPGSIHGQTLEDLRSIKLTTHRP